MKFALKRVGCGVRKNSVITANSQLSTNNYLHASFDVKMKKLATGNIGKSPYEKITRKINHIDRKRLN